MPISITDSTIKLVWENNPDTSLSATNLSKSVDMIASYLDFDNESHDEGNTILAFDSESGNGMFLKLKKGTIISLINTETIDGTENGIKILSENDHYRMFDIGLEDIWITISDMDNNPSNPTGSWGSNKEWFVYICDKMDDTEIKTNSDDYGGGGQILVSQGRKYPIGQIPGQDNISYSQKSTRKIGGFKTDSGGKIIAASVWDIAQKNIAVRAKGYYIFDEYDVNSSDYNRFTNRPLRVSDLDSASSATPIYNNFTVASSSAATPVIKADITNNLVTATNINVSGDATISGTATITGNTIINGNATITGSVINDGGISGSRYRLFESIASNYLEIASANGTQPIYVRQYSTNFGTINNSVTLLDSSGNTAFPGQVTTSKIVSTGSSATICNIAFNTSATAPTGSSRINCEGYFYATRVYNAVWNDLAEFFLSSDEKEYGKVYIIDESGLVKRSNRRAQVNAIGVASDTAGFLLKQEYEDRGVPIGLAGSVNVWVKSKIKTGKELVSDTDGFAVEANWFEKIFNRDAIIGKTIGCSIDSTAKRILMLVK